VGEPAHPRDRDLARGQPGLLGDGEHGVHDGRLALRVLGGLTAQSPTRQSGKAVDVKGSVDRGGAGGGSL
jgi:hypothetical protein